MIKKDKYFRYISLVLFLTFFLTLFNMLLNFEQVLFDFFGMVSRFPYLSLLINSNYLLLLSLLLMLYSRWRDEMAKRRKSEEAMMSLHRATENMQIGVTITDTNRIIGYVNPAEAEMHGYSVEELIGKDARVLGPPEIRNYDVQPVPKGIRHETTNIRKDGGEFPVQLMSDAVITPEGKVLAVVTTCEDISERKRMEHEKEKLIGELEGLIALISRSQREWTETFDAITDVIFLSDLDFTITRVNRATEKMLGMPIKEILGRKCHELFHCTEAAAPACAGCTPLRTGNSIASSWFQKELNRFLDMKIIPRFNNNKELVGLVHVVRDVTDQKKLEDRLAHARKIEAVGQLAGGIAHDFNNILTSIISSVKLLERKIDRESNLSTHVKQILDASETGANLVRGLLSFSGKQSFYPVPMDLNSLIRRSVHLFRGVVAEEIDFRFELADYALTVMADKTELERVLINLVANARDAMPAGGMITITTAEVQLGSDLSARLNPGRYAMVGIMDDGIGMDEKITARIFDPFFTTKEVGKGTGLGLSLVYGIIRQHEGEIEVHSSPGMGTVVKIFLPLVKEDGESRADDGARLWS